MFDSKRFFTYLFVLIGLCCSIQSKTNDIFDAVDMDSSTLRQIHSCVIMDHYDYILRTQNPEITFKLSNFEDKSFVVITPDLGKLKKRFVISERKKDYNSFPDQSLSLLQEKLSELGAQNIIFSGAGNTASSSLYMAITLQKNYREPKRVKVVVFSPSISLENTYKDIYEVIDPKNILFFIRRPLLRSTDRPFFPGIPIEILPWEDSISVLPRNISLVSGIITTGLAFKFFLENRGDIHSNPYFKYAAFSWAIYVFSKVVEKPYIPSINILEVAYREFQHRWQYRQDGVENSVFSGDQALFQAGQVSLGSQTRNPLVSFILKISGGY